MTFHLPLPPSVNEELSVPLREQQRHKLEGKQGGKEKDEAREGWKSKIKMFTFPHGNPIISTLLFLLSNTFPSVISIFFFFF